MKNLLLWGAQGQAKVLNEFAASQGYRLIALIDNDERITSPFEQLPVFHHLRLFQTWLQQEHDGEPLYFSVAIGGDRGKTRMELHQTLTSLDYQPATLIHPSSFVASNAHIGDGSQILACAAVCAEAQIAAQCIVNTGATVDHETILQDGVHVCPGAHLLGNVFAAQYATIGAGAVIFPKIKIGEGSVVGAGSIVRKDVAPYCVVVGNPAKFLKYVEA